MTGMSSTTSKLVNDLKSRQQSASTTSTSNYSRSVSVSSSTSTSTSYSARASKSGQLQQVSSQGDLTAVPDDLEEDEEMSLVSPSSPLPIVESPAETPTSLVPAGLIGVPAGGKEGGGSSPLVQVKSKFEQKVSSKSRTMVVSSDGFSSEESRSSKSQMKRVQSGELVNQSSFEFQCIWFHLLIASKH
jgi:hypothetical protein